MNDFLNKYRLPLFAKEDEQGGGDDAPKGDDTAGTDRSDPEFKSGLGGGLLDRGKADDADDGKADPNNETPAGDGRPDGVPAKFWDAKKGEVNVDGMSKAYNDLETAHGKLKRDKGQVGGEVPDDAADYFKDGLELPDGVDNLRVDGPDDPGLKAWGEVCHEMGVGKELAVKLAQQMFGKMNEHAPAPIDPDVEFDSLGKGAEALIEGINVWAQGLELSKKISESDVSVINELSMTADGIRFLSSMRDAAGEERIPLLENTTQEHMTAATWNEAYKEAVAKKDYVEQARLDKIGEKIHGTHASNSGPRGGVDPERNGLKRSA